MPKLLDENSLRAVKTYVDNVVGGLPAPMSFKGTVGTGGTKTWSNYATGAKSGWTYKVITDHSTTPVCKAGDVIIYDGSEWAVIPSGNEPGGTVTSVNAAGAANSHIQVSNGPITDRGSLTIGIEAGYSIPSNEKQAEWDTYRPKSRKVTIEVSDWDNLTFSVSLNPITVGEFDTLFITPSNATAQEYYDSGITYTIVDPSDPSGFQTLVFTATT